MVTSVSLQGGGLFFTDYSVINDKVCFSSLSLDLSSKLRFRLNGSCFGSLPCLSTCTVWRWFLLPHSGQVRPCAEQAFFRLGGYVDTFRLISGFPDCCCATTSHVTSTSWTRSFITTAILLWIFIAVQQTRASIAAVWVQFIERLLIFLCGSWGFTVPWPFQHLKVVAAWSGDFIRSFFLNCCSTRSGFLFRSLNWLLLK